MYERILVGIDGSEAASRACVHAIAIAQCMGGKVVVAAVAVERGSHRASWSDAADHPIPLEEAGARAEAEAARVRAAGVQVSTKILEGPAAEALAKEAAVGEYHLLAIGERGRRGVLAGPRLGTTAVELARTTPCALLVVP